MCVMYVCAVCFVCVCVCVCVHTCACTCVELCSLSPIVCEGEFALFATHANTDNVYKMMDATCYSILLPTPISTHLGHPCFLLHLMDCTVCLCTLWPETVVFSLLYARECVHNCAHNSDKLMSTL